jgi:hypothetical protein
MSVTSAGGGATGGYDLSVIQSQNEGGQYLSSATGGSFFGNSRNFDDYFETLSGLVGAYYSIGYRSPTGAPDGMLHPVSVEVVRDGLKVRTHERVPNPTRDQNLANMAISRLMINEGPNPLGLRVSLGPTEPAEGDRYIQEIRLQVPAANLMLEEDGPNHVGTLVVAVVAADEKGEPLPPRMLQLTVSLPSERLAPETIALSRLRLMMESGSLNLAVAIRDEGSGTEASARASLGS